MVDALTQILHALDAMGPYAAPFIWAFRVVAACAGTFVLLDVWRHWNPESEIPPYDKHSNARGWALASVGAVLGGVGFNALDVYWLSTYDAENPNLIVALIVALVWGAWAAGLTQRAASRAEQPTLIWSAAGLITAGGLLVTSLGGRVP